jgi:hypothetical protein
MRADAATFRVWTSLRAFENEECLFARTWTFDIPRDGGQLRGPINPGGTERIDRRAVRPHAGAAA